MVINPFCHGANTTAPKNVGACICDHAIDSSCRGKSKVVACVDCELVNRLQADDEAGPLRWGCRNCPVGLCNVTHRGLRSWGEACNEQENCGECSPCAWELIAIDIDVDGGRGEEG